VCGRCVVGGNAMVIGGAFVGVGVLAWLPFGSLHRRVAWVVARSVSRVAGLV
jgi:hypothetical protein